MSTGELAHMAMMLLGGVGLFLFGMESLVSALTELAGMRSRAIIEKMAKNNVTGMIGGTAVASITHSNPAIVLIMGFVNAGILAFPKTIGMVIGANIGTTLSMQIVAFDIGKYAFLGLGAGVVLRIAFKRQNVRLLGMVLIGLGLLFFGLDVMKAAMEPLKGNEQIASTIASLSIDSTGGFFLGVLAATALTALYQSSGATISILFSLAALGLITDPSQAVPFILGAHVGTCTTGILAAINNGAGAWRVAFAHLGFNVIGIFLVFPLANVYGWIVSQATSDPLHQIAHLNSLIQIVNGLIFLPFCGLYAKGIKMIAPGHGEEIEASHLNLSLVKTPEDAIRATLKELRRESEIVIGMMKIALDGVVSLDKSKFRMVQAREKTIDTIRLQIEKFLNLVGERQISPRQGRMLQRLIIVTSALERIGDHIETICKLTEYKTNRNIWFTDEMMNSLLDLSQVVQHMMEKTMDSLDPEHPQRRENAKEVLRLRREYKAMSQLLMKKNNEQFSPEGSEGATPLFFVRYLMVFDRIVSQLREIAKEEKARSFFIDEEQLSKVEPVADRKGRPQAHRLAKSHDEAIQKSRAIAQEMKKPNPVPSSDESIIPEGDEEE